MVETGLPGSERIKLAAAGYSGLALTKTSIASHGG